MNNLVIPLRSKHHFAFVVSRIKPNQIQNSEEIPFAKRNSSLTASKLKSNRVLLFFVLILFILSSLVSLIAFNQKNKGIPNNQADDPLSEALLGHLPYPEVSNDKLVSVLPGLEVHLDTYRALTLMSAAAERDGIKLILLSGFRSIELQKEIFYENKSIRNQIAVERAKVSAPPGYSEHSTGYAVDFGDGTMRYTDFEVEFESTPAFEWLINNAAKYHFVMSFPKENVQGVSYEPWHWRFEGTVEALKKFKKANKLLSSEQIKN